MLLSSTVEECRLSRLQRLLSGLRIYHSGGCATWLFFCRVNQSNCSHQFLQRDPCTFIAAWHKTMPGKIFREHRLLSFSV